MIYIRFGEKNNEKGKCIIKMIIGIIMALSILGMGEWFLKTMSDIKHD